MDVEGKKNVQLKYALALSKLLKENKLLWLGNKEKGIKNLSLIYNISQLSDETGLRTATLSSIFNGDSNLSGTTLATILKKLGKSFEQFGRYYDSLTSEEIEEFEHIISIKKKEKVPKDASNEKLHDEST